MNVTRAQVVTALKELGVDPTTTDEVMIFPDKVIVRQRAIMMIEDPEAPAGRTGESQPHIHTETPGEHAHAHG